MDNLVASKTIIQKSWLHAPYISKIFTKSTILNLGPLSFTLGSKSYYKKPCPTHDL